MNKLIYFLVFFFLLISISHASNSADLFETESIKIEFKSENIEKIKNNKLKELKIYSLNKIFKNILVIDDYKKISRKMNTNFTDIFIKSIIIDNEKILNDRYSANVKINYNKKIIIDYLRNNKISYVEFIPENFFTIILDDFKLQKNLFTKNNDFYKFLLNSNNNYLNFYKIPNLDINDRFLLNPDDIINGNFDKIDNILNKYKARNFVIIHSFYQTNDFRINVYMNKNNSLLLTETFNINDKDVKYILDYIKPLIINNWKKNNLIQNSTLNQINCTVKSFNIYELRKIISILKSNSLIRDLKLKEISLYKNLYQLNYYGNMNILEKMLNNHFVVLKYIDENQCEIYLK